MSGTKKKEVACRFLAGETVLVDIHVDHQVIVKRAKILRLTPTWAILKLGNRSVTAFLSQLRPAPEAGHEARGEA